MLDRIERQQALRAKSGLHRMMLLNAKVHVTLAIGDDLTRGERKRLVVNLKIADRDILAILELKKRGEIVADKFGAVAVDCEAVRVGDTQDRRTLTVGWRGSSGQIVAPAVQRQRRAGR